MADAARARKVADRIHETVARLLQGRIKDPRLGFVTVTDVRVTGDLQQATIFYTVYGSDEEREETAKALRSAKGLIRSEVGRALGVLGERVLAQAHGRLIGLVGADEVGQQTRGPADAQHQETGGHRIESTRMPDLASGGQAPSAGDDVMAGQPRRLVDQDNAVASRHGPSRRTRASRAHASASSAPAASKSVPSSVPSSASSSCL